jgi:F-type H+-transporting ATPase subunit gamma
MPSLKAFRNRISSVKATRKITRAMQMVAAAKLRRAQEAALAARPYSDRMATVLGNLSRGMDGRPDAPALLAGRGTGQTHLLVVATAERGLCGNFNSSIVKLAREQADRLMAEGRTVKIFCVGKKGHDQLKRLYGRYIIEAMDFRGVKQPGYAQAQAVGTRILQLFEDGQFDVATIFFAEFKSVITQRPRSLRLIPAEVPAGDKLPELGGAIHDAEPDETEILADLLPRNINVQIYRALLENAASEQGARMSAMDSATRNAGDMIDSLTLNYNRQRQAQITKELIEIISGAEAL